MDPTKPVVPGQAPVTPAPTQPVATQPTGMPTSTTVPGTAPTADVAQPQVANYVKPPAAAAPNVVDETQQKQTLLGKIFQTLAGGARMEYSVDPNTGKTVSTPVNLKPGEMFRGILAGALTGLAAGAIQRGPGAGLRSFGAGFIGREAQMQQQEQQKKQEAQQEFQNEGEAQKRLYAQHADARAQQKSFWDSKLAADLDKQYAQDLQLRKFDLSEKVTAEALREQEQIQNDEMLGIQPVMVDGKPAPEFDSGDEASQFAVLHKDKLLKDFKGLARYDIATGKWRAVVVPPNFDTPGWQGAVLKDGVPVRDKNGDVVPNGKLKDNAGNAFAVYDTPNRVSQYQARQLDSTYKNAEIVYKRAQTAAAYATAKERLMAVTKNAGMQAAWDHYSDAMEAGGIDAVNPKTKQPYLTPAERRLLASGMRLTVANDQTALIGYMRLAEGGNPPDGIQGLITDAQKKFAQDRGFVETLQAPNPAYLNTYAQNLNTKFGTDNGSKVKAIDADQNLSPENKQKLRQMVTGTAPAAAGAQEAPQIKVSPESEKFFNDVVGRSEKFSGGLTPIEMYDQIQKLPVPPDQKMALAKEHNAQVPWSAVVSLAQAHNTTPQQAAASLKAAGLDVQPEQFGPGLSQGQTTPFGPTSQQ